MRAKKAALVINPRTGQNVAKITDVLAVLVAAGWKPSIALKEYGGHSMELANEAASDKSDLVIAYGGDGTLSQVVNGVLNAKGQHSIVGVIPGGTANVWAGEIGVPVDPVKAALSLINSESRKVDVGHVAVESITFPEVDGRQTQTADGDNDGANGKKTASKKSKVARSKTKAKQYFLLMGGLGIDAAIMGNVSKPLKYRIGPLAVGISAAKELPAYRSFPVEIRTTDNDEPLWKGEAAQIVIGNTRRYADVAEMTPNAYIDDGVLNLCVITAGDPLTTLQQISSLLLRRKPDNLTAEYFHGAHLYITVPASVPMQLDGSAVKLKDYLKKSEYAILQQAMARGEQAMITYRFDAMPRALEVAIPRTYDDALFERSHSADGVQDNGARSNKEEGQKRSLVKAQRRGDEEIPQTESQRRTEAEESRPASQQRDVEGKDRHQDEIQKELPESMNSLLENGRKVTVIGKMPNPEKKNTYIIAGTAVKQSTGEARPVAVVVSGDTTISDREGEHISSDAIRDIQQGMVIVVEGKKSKRGVITATRMVM